MTKLTPARRQYLNIKRQYPDAIVFFRMGDFYETFDDDAILTARELDITLTKRTEGQPMAGVPYHALDNYVARLVDKGYHVAICDQVSEPSNRGIVDREVTRVLTPGTLVEPALLNQQQQNYLMVAAPLTDPRSTKWTGVGIAYVDVSTGEFAATQVMGDQAAVALFEEMARITPRELLLPAAWKDKVTLPEGVYPSYGQDYWFDARSAKHTLLDHFKLHNLDSFGLSEWPLAVAACAAAVEYLRATHKSTLAQLTDIRAYTTSAFMVLDPFTRRNLELTQTIRAGRMQGSLLSVIDRTVTPMGARTLRTWISQPLLELPRINARLNAVEALTSSELLRAELREALKHILDLERLINRVIIQKATPRDLIALASGLELIPKLAALVGPYPALEPISDRLNPCPQVSQLIRRAIVDEPPANLNQINVIRAGFSLELDDLKAKSEHARRWIAELEPQERQRTGIASLKVGFNKVFGYYIEVTTANADKVPADYVRKQTLVNAERYITPDLKEYETLVLNAEEEILALERQIFEDVCRQISQHSDALLRTARTLATLDALLSLATVAVAEGYCRPKMTEGDTLMIRNGRHPVVEWLLPNGQRYTPNDTHFHAGSRLHILTGPNMAGKSTYIRQVALITLLAHIGSFVPAEAAEIGLVDRIFARIGAQDEIHAGQSTFMVEMVETARLLIGATNRSLIILDEIGRGTSTYDGLAIARAVVEYIHNNPRLNCRTLFATHYHELTELPNVLPRAENFNVAVTERGETIVFLHKVVRGGADRSYGVHVAQLAGMPKPVVQRARELLTMFEHEMSRQSLPLFSAPPAPDPTPAPEHPALAALRALNVDHLTPIEAITHLYALKKLLSS